MSDRIRKVNSARPNPTGTSQLMRSLDDSMRPLDAVNNSDTEETFKDILLEDLVPYDDNDNVFGIDEAQVDAMADDIKKNGFHGSITVSKLNDGKYRILSGHQRALAAKKAGLHKIPANIDSNTSQTHQFEVWMKSNSLSRKQTPYRYYAMCYKAKLFIEERKKIGDPDFANATTRALIANMTNLSETQVGRYLRFGNLPAYTLQCCDNPTFPYTTVLKVAGFDGVRKEAFDHELKTYVEGREANGLELEPQDIKQLVAKVEKGKGDFFENDDNSKPVRHKRGKFYDLPDEAQQLYFDSYDSLKRRAKDFKENHDETTVLDEGVADLSVKLSCMVTDNANGVSDPKKLSAAIKLLEEDLKKLKEMDGVYEF